MVSSQEDLKLCEARMKHASITGDNVVRSPVPDIIIEECTVPEFVWKNADKFSSHKALTCGISGRSYTYSEARDKSRRLAKALLKSGLESGDVLAVLLPNIPEYGIIFLGALEAGLIVSTANPGYTKYEIDHQVKTSGAKCMVTIPSLVPTVREVAASLGHRMPIIAVTYDEGKGRSEGCWDLDDMLKADLDQEVRSSGEPGDIAALPFSSGTTGLSKGVQLTHTNIISNMQQSLAGSFYNPLEATSERQDVVPAVLPLFHIYGLHITLRALSRGSHIITLPKFDPKSYLKILASQKPLSCRCYCVPQIISFLGTNPLVTSDILKSVRVTCTGAGPVGAGDIENLLNKVPNREQFVFCNGYGLTETSPVVFTPLVGNTDLTSVGVPVPNTQIRVVDASGKNLGPREHGEIYVKGPQVMKGYHKDEKATAEAFDNDWFKTGDVGYYDEKSNFYIVERLKELIKVKGFQVPPAELEAVLRGHPDVVDVGVIGVPDERTGEKPIAFIVPKPGVCFEPEKVSEFVAEQVAPFKQLGGIITTDSIPRNPSGKILRKILREQYAKKH